MASDEGMPNVETSDDAVLRIQACVNGRTVRSDLQLAGYPVSKIQAGIQGYEIRAQIASTDEAASRIAAGILGHQSRKESNSRWQENAAAVIDSQSSTL